MTQILSIQSAVAYGHAGNSAAVFPLQRLGIDVWPVYTVNFSNHTGYGSWRGPLIAADDVLEVVRGIDDRGVLAGVDALLSGYQGGAEVGRVILEAAALVKQRNPEAIYCCDPVMGDFGRGFYARPGIPEFMRDHVVPAADVMSPNLFELEFLTGRSELTTVAQTVVAAHELRARGPRTVLVTSVVHPGDEQVMRMVAVTADGSWQVETPLIDRNFTGSGDLTTAVFLAHLLRTGDPAAALSATASIVYGILRRTADAGSSELVLVPNQDQIVAPTHTFEAVPVAG
ncbi:pyridoxal kinase PdxY [Aestuariimicrobium ganziense]|uniref:pyridoxal kinase PdxY n=1 Tax=Aestuariimicrobium ganziense TaxID=2773677 RepID=UPI0019428B8A|nr:pyridoxal kinase PdxY [Aestuariimicrobium ganziense]